MNILSTTRELSKKEVYLMTGSSAIQNSIKDLADGEVIKSTGAIIFEKEDSKGKVVKLMSIIDINGIVYTTVSETAIKAYNEIFEVFGYEEGTLDIVKMSGTTKADKEYVTFIIA